MAVFGRSCLALSATLVAFAAPAKSDHGYAGAQACAKCHAAVHRHWAASPHANMLQPAKSQSIPGDSHHIDFTLGSHRIRECLTTLPDGRIVVLPKAWNIAGQKWVDIQDVHNPEQSGDASVWNKSCYSCHVSGGRKNFDIAQLTYQTTWRDKAIDCETCHGPGAEHIANPPTRIVNPARLDARRSTMVCAECHSSRDTYVDGFKAGADYYDYFVPVMQYRLPPSDDPAYWADGRPRTLPNEAFGLWESQCFLKGGATCVTCHSQPHASTVRNSINATCNHCHQAIAARVTAHTHHAATSAGSSCVECHMPAVVSGVGAQLRDHTISIPVPENSAQYAIPNACNVCHNDKDAGWARKQMNEWYGDKSRQKLIRRADAFVAAQKGDASAVPALLQILADPSGGPLIRANAAGFLGNFPNDPGAYDAVLRSFADPEALVRATAILAIRPRAAQRETVAPQIVRLLHDSVATVRMNAAVALVAMGVQHFPGEDGERFERAKALYRARADLVADDAAQQFAAGKFSLLSGNMDAAAAAFRAALKLDSGMPAQYYLAVALSEKGGYREARDILKAIPRNDLQYAPAQRLLAQIETKSPNSDAAHAQFVNAQVAYEKGDWGPALTNVEQALRSEPRAEWAINAEIVRAICLEKLARTAEAGPALRALSENAAAKNDVDLQAAYIELLYETGRQHEALARADQLIAAAPDAPLAHFWRAKVLLAMHRTDEAAGAAEQAMRLQPDLPNAHNLLVRIYQMQGRTKEAAQQAQWLREYQQRIESR